MFVKFSEPSFISPKIKIIDGTANAFGVTKDWLLGETNALEGGTNVPDPGNQQFGGFENKSSSSSIQVFQLKIRELQIKVEELAVIQRSLDKEISEKDVLIAELRQDKKMLIEDKERLLGQLGNKREQA
jgi:hypothetical protein